MNQNFKWIRLHRSRFLFFAFCLLASSLEAGILRAGDILDINVTDHPELSKKVMLKGDGTIDYPFLEDRSLQGMTTQEVGELLTFRLAKSISNPFVLVTRTEFMPVNIRVLGQVAKPGVVQLSKGACLQEVVMAAGGPTEAANLADIKIIREKGTDADALHVDYRAFLERGELDALPEIRNNDTVILLAAPRDLKVKVLGNVSRPGYYAIQGETSIFDIIYLAGGPAEKADLSKVRHIIQSEGKNLDQVVDLQEFIDKGKMKEIPKVHEGDVIIVYKKFITWSVFLGVLRDAIMLLTVYKVFASGL